MVSLFYLRTSFTDMLQKRKAFYLCIFCERKCTGISFVTYFEVDGSTRRSKATSESAQCAVTQQLSSPLPLLQEQPQEVVFATGEAEEQSAEVPFSLYIAQIKMKEGFVHAASWPPPDGSQCTDAGIQFLTVESARDMQESTKGTTE